MDGNMNNGYGQQNYNQQNYNQQNYNQPNYGPEQNGMGAGFGGYNQTPNTGKAPEFTLWLVVGIVLTVFGCCCCCGGGITVPIVGILLIIFTCLGNNAYKRGDMLGYQKWFKANKITIIVGVILIILNVVIGLVSGLFASVAETIGYY